jgi:RNA recognition motif-containing protein
MNVSGLPKHFDKFDLQRLFNPFGWVDYTKILIDPITGLSRGKGIVEMKKDEDAKKAIAALQGQVLATSPLNIKEAKDRPRPNDGGDQGGGGGRGRDGGDQGGRGGDYGGGRGRGY